jgi:hypothetical protein
VWFCLYWWNYNKETCEYKTLECLQWYWCQTDKIGESAVTNIKNFFQVKIIDGETLFACNICNEGVDYEHSIKWHIYDKHEDLTLDILNSDEDTDAEEVKCVKIIRNSTEPYNSASLHR